MPATILLSTSRSSSRFDHRGPSVRNHGMGSMGRWQVAVACPEPVGWRPTARAVRLQAQREIGESPRPGRIRTTPGRRCRFAEDPLTHDGEAAARIAGTARPPCPLLDHVLVTVEPSADRPPVVRRSDTGFGHGMVERGSPHPRGPPCSLRSQERRDAAPPRRRAGFETIDRSERSLDAVPLIGVEPIIALRG